MQGHLQSLGTQQRQMTVVRVAVAMELGKPGCRCGLWHCGSGVCKSSEKQQLTHRDGWIGEARTCESTLKKTQPPRLDDSKLPFGQVFQIDSSDLYHINRNLDIRMAV